jgi:tetratricopeptide (TPR) repeat protein
MTNKVEDQSQKRKLPPSILAGPFRDLLLMALLLGGCASVPPQTEPTQPVNPAVLSLLEGARNDIAGSHYSSAEAKLERALRIEPGNAMLWYELADVALQQGNLAQAENFALRAHSFSGNNRQLQQRIWYLIGESRNRRSDYEGADAAFLRAQSYSQ